MESNQSKKRAYLTPETETVCVAVACPMLDTSYPGQHNGATHGGTVPEEDESGGAKKMSLFDTTNNDSFWKD